MFKFHQLYYNTSNFLCHHRNFFTYLIRAASALVTMKLAKVKGSYMTFATELLLPLSDPIGCDSRESSYCPNYCCLVILIFAVTVAVLKRVITTAVFECFPNQIAVARAGCAGFYCLFSYEKQQKLQYLKSFLLFLLSVQKNQVLNQQYVKDFLFFVLSFLVGLTVVNSKSEMWTVAYHLD